MIYLFTEKYDDTIEHYFYNSSDKHAYSVEIYLENGLADYYLYHLEKQRIRLTDSFDYVIPTVLKCKTSSGIFSNIENEILNIIFSGI